MLAQGSKERTLEEPTQQLEETQNRIREFERRAFAKLGVRGKVPDDDPGAPAPVSPK
jgi:hypothetical protein